jgi:hypothetical protein
LGTGWFSRCPHQCVPTWGLFFREAYLSAEDAPIDVGRECNYKINELQRAVASVSGGVSARRDGWWIGRGGTVILAKRKVDLR